MSQYIPLDTTGFVSNVGRVMSQYVPLDLSVM